MCQGNACPGTCVPRHHGDESSKTFLGRSSRLISLRRDLRACVCSMIDFDFPSMGNGAWHRVKLRALCMACALCETDGLERKSLRAQKDFDEPELPVFAMPIFARPRVACDVFFFSLFSREATRLKRGTSGESEDYIPPLINPRYGEIQRTGCADRLAHASQPDLLACALFPVLATNKLPYICIFIYVCIYSFKVRRMLIILVCSTARRGQRNKRNNNLDYVAIR